MGFTKAIVVLVMAAAALPAWTPAKAPDGFMPIVALPDQLVVSPGGSFNVTVVLDGRPMYGQTVSLESDRPGTFGIPSTVTVPAGQDRASFKVSVYPTFQSGPATITASCNGGFASGAVLIQPFPDK